MNKWALVFACFITILSCGSSAWASEPICLKQIEQTTDDGSTQTSDCEESGKLLTTSLEEADTIVVISDLPKIQFIKAPVTAVTLPRGPPDFIPIFKMLCCYRE